MRRRIAGCMMILFFILASYSAKAAWAAVSQIAPLADDVDYSTGVGRKLGRGICNVLFGWLEFPKGIEDVATQNNVLAGITWGPIYGLEKTVARTLAGAYEVVTFPVPIPKDFKSVIEPEFILNNLS